MRGTLTKQARRIGGRVKRRAGGQLHRWRRLRARWTPPRSDPPSVVLRGSPEAGYRVPWPAYPPPGYLGQLVPSYQEKLAKSRAWIGRDDCHFYHATTLPDGEVIQGAWDLRGREDAYLGGAHLDGRRILELGPASGHLTRYMEAVAGEVVSFDVGFDRSVDLLPRYGEDPEWARMDAMSHICMVQNSWWYLARQFDSSAKMVYGNIYELPGDIGVFDVSVLAAILLHLRNPFDALQQSAGRTARQIVVTEPLQDPTLPSDHKLMRFAPFGNENPGNWWLFTPGMIVEMLTHLGFARTHVTYHTQPHHLAHDLTKPAQDLAMFTVVGERI